MKQRNVVLYIAMSLDGYIAKADGDISWLSMVETPGEDYGYSKFIQTIDTVILGRKTYDKVLSFGIPFPHKGRKCYVLSRSKTGTNENVTFHNSSMKALLEKIRKEDGKDIFCDGGAETIFELMRENLVDNYVISIIPIMLGGGIRLFKEGYPEHQLKLTETRRYPTGLVQLWYEKSR
jgi:dihydrofolate reductase